jgi:hypothetical protein
MSKRHFFVLCAVGALVVAVAFAGCTEALRKRVLVGAGRVVASPTLPTLISEVAAILLSDEWRDQLVVKAREVGRDRVRAAVEANSRKPAPVAAGAVRSPAGSPLGVHREREAPIDPAVIIQSRALLWLADDDRAQSCGSGPEPVTRSDCPGL